LLDRETLTAYVPPYTVSSRLPISAFAMRFLLAALVGALSFASPLFGQASQHPADSSTVAIPRWHVGVAADIGQPLGAFKQHVNNAVGLQAHVLLRLDRHGLTAIRLQGGWLNYGRESQRGCLGTTPSCRVAVDVTTANGILSLGVGPQFSLPLGPLRTYGFGLVGVSRSATLSGIGGGIVPDIVAADENFSDAGLVWSSGVGIQLPLHQSITIDVGVAYQGHGRRNYLIKGGLTDNPDGSLAFDIKRSNVASLCDQRRR
jgi:opacity protein-like surface antigen